MSPSMKVMELRQFAVFMKAGSYVIRPKSSSDALICRRSMALMVPSWMGSSYFLPVRLSTIVSVSAIEVSSRPSRSAVAPSGWSGRQTRSVRIVLASSGRRIHRLRSHAIGAVRPARQILQLAALAAEGSPFRLHRMLPAEDAQRRLLRWGHRSILSKVERNASMTGSGTVRGRRSATICGPNPVSVERLRSVSFGTPACRGASRRAPRR